MYHSYFSIIKFLYGLQRSKQGDLFVNFKDFNYGTFLVHVLSLQTSIRENASQWEIKVFTFIIDGVLL
jgi:hypothetical protein